MREAPPINVIKSAEGRARLRAKAQSGVRLRTSSPEDARREAGRIAFQARQQRRAR